MSVPERLEKLIAMSPEVGHVLTELCDHCLVKSYHLADSYVVAVTNLHIYIYLQTAMKIFEIPCG